MTNENKADFPQQTIASSAKTEKWYKQNVDSAIKSIETNSSGSVRFTRKERDILYKLGTDELDPRDMANTFNPLNIEDMKESFKNIKNVPFEQGIFKLLKGEEAQRPFKYQVKRLNPEAIAEVNEKKKAILVDYMTNVIDSEQLDEEQAKAKLEDVIDSIHSYRDIKAIRAKKLIDKIERNNSLNSIFSDTFVSKLYVGEEIAFFDFVNGDLKVQSVNGLNLYMTGTGTSNKVEDSDIIVYVDYLNTSQIISYYRNYLTKAQLKDVEGGCTSGKEGYGSDYQPAAPTYIESNGAFKQLSSFNEDQFISNSSHQSANGDIRVCRVFWKGKQLIKAVDIIDSDGNVFTEMHDGSYTVMEELGEVLKEEIYIDMWEEGTLIGENIYVKMQPYEGNVYSKTDLSLRSHPFIGYITTLNNVGAVSLMNTIKNLKYLYNVIRHEYELAIGKNLGNVIEMDMAYIPNKEGWDIDKVYYYMKAAGMKIVDSLNTTVEGKYLPNNTTGRTSNLSQFDHIQTLSSILESIKNEVHEITGVTSQRLGQVSNRETKGGIERSVQQSSNTTEPEFRDHEVFKNAVYANLLELSKIWIAGGQVALSDWSDGFFQFIDNIDGEEFAESDYGLYVSDTYNDIKLKGIIEEMAPTLLQAQVIPMSAYLEIMENDDVNYSSMVIKRAERRKEKQDQQQQQANAKAQEEQREDAITLSQLEFDRAKHIKQMELSNLELLQRLKNENNLELHMLDSEAKDKKLEIEAEIARNKDEINRIKMQEEKNKSYVENNFKEKELEVKKEQSKQKLN